MKSPCVLKMTILVIFLLFRGSHGGFQSPDPVALSRALFGSPCDCGGGTFTVRPATYTQEVDCGEKTAYLAYRHSITGVSKPKWECVRKPRVIPPNGGQPGPCPSDCNYLEALHSTCYSSTQQCSGSSGTVYLTTIQEREYGGSTGGDWAHITSQGLRGSTNKYAQASCRKENIGKNVCWPLHAPVHISDGGGPTDQIREHEVRERINEIIKSMYPPIHYHPLALPKPRGTDLDVQTSEILEATLKALNYSNPDLAADCWLCMALGTPMPIALMSKNGSTSTNCTLSPPFKVQPVGLRPSPCIQAPFQNSTADIDVGFATFANCSEVKNYTSQEPLCPLPGQLFACGGNMAYSALPQNWTGLCTQISILPDIDIIPGDEPVPLPSFDYITGRPKRAVAFIPLLVGLGITGALATGSAGIGVAVDSYTKLSHQFLNDVQTLSGTINDLQDQIDSLAGVVLQNRRGLDLLTAEQGGICLALQEKCCFYANKSGIVRDKIKKLQEDLIERRRKLFENPLWSGLNGVLPYLLPLLGPLIGLLLLFSFGPWAFTRLTSFIKTQIEASLKNTVNIHYHQLASSEDPTDTMEEGLQFSKLVHPESRCSRWWRNIKDKK
ncbi:syncytin-1-like [Phascolarctos cinereus]|nr:syncytin-1-like isoform X2 [Phascolarctos cinereus]XP_020843559.1 syncytin-1-like isoform X2 [Phascolarctos cinereus]XP_020857733.1 syncytin-1-like isoform X2 [Phascolarctos cinereus]